MTKNILNSDAQKRFNVTHLDTADRRSLTNIDTIDFTNIYLAFKHFFCFLKLCVLKNPKIVYLPISQGILGYLRDCLFLVPAEIFRRKIIVHLHGCYFRELYDKSNILVKFLIRLSLKNVNRAIVLSESLRYIFEGLVPEERIAVVPNGIEDFYIYGKIGSNFKKVNKIRVLFLSTLAKAKGFIDVVKAIPEVVSDHSNVEFVFAGELWLTETEKREVDYIIATKELRSNIKLQGVVIGSKKMKLLLSSDIFVFPSHNDVQGLVNLEAMAASLPIITTNVGIIKETVIDGENGFIVEKKNPKQITEKILLLLENENLRKEMGRKGRLRFLKYYTKDRFIENLSDVFRKVLSE